MKAVCLTGGGGSIDGLNLPIVFWQNFSSSFTHHNLSIIFLGFNNPLLLLLLHYYFYYFYRLLRTCKYHRVGYIVNSSSFSFGEHKEFFWEYRKYFNCDSQNVVYLLQCNYCWQFYIGETGNLKERIRTHVSNVLHPGNANCTKLNTHLHHCSQLREPFFLIYPYYFVQDMHHRRFIEKRHIRRYNPPLNSDL